MHSHDSIVQRLLEAKAAVDEKDNEGRGLGQGFGGTSRGMNHCEEVDAMLIIQDFLCFDSSLWKLAQNICNNAVASMSLDPVFTGKTFSIDDFSVTVFWSDHCNPKLITHP